MNKGTSKVNWDEVTTNKAKIAEYKERVLGHKYRIGFMELEKTKSVKAHSYKPYTGVGENYSGYVANAKDNKANDQKV